jgi:hypothetical protein
MMANPQESKTDAEANATRQVLASMEDVRDAMIEVAGTATRNIAILTQDLESGIFDSPKFIKVVQHLCLTQSIARIRILVSNPFRTLRDGNRFVYLGRRLSSFIEFRHVHESYRRHQEVFLIADDRALVFRTDPDRWDGIADTNEPRIARRYLKLFDEIWASSESAQEFRQLST